MIKVAQCWDDGVATDIPLTEILRKYNAKATKTILVRLNLENDKDIIEHLEKQKSRMGYIKRLIREDMEGKANGKRHSNNNN